MSNQSKKLMPKLRFPEFKNAEDWTLTMLGKLASRVTLRNKNTTVSRVFTNSAVDGVVDQRDYFDKDIANQNNLGNYFIVDDGCYVYNPRISNTAPVGPISKNKIGKGVMSPLYTVFRFNSSENDFYEQFFKTDNWYSYLRNISNSGARHDRMSITNDAFMEMPLPYTSPKEQQKIAGCLSSLDDLITAQNQKVEALKQHKKGLMQQLFPAEGETLPKLRVPEFESDEEWDFLSGDNAFEPISNKRHNSDLPILAITQEYGAIPREMIDYKVIATEQSIDSYKVVEVGDFIISLRSFQGGIEYSNYKGICSPAYIILRKKIKVSDLFFKYYFKTDLFIRDLNKNIEGIRDGKMVSFTQFSEKLLPLPKYAEQEKIADCLSSIDDVITTQTNKLEALKEHKKGLMQRLFPSIDEVAM